MNNLVTQTERNYTPQQLQLIKRTIADGTTNEEFSMFIEMCKRQKLNPFSRQVHVVIYNKDKEDKRKVVFITGIDGYRAIAKRTGEYRPSDKEPVIEYDEKEICPDTNPLGIVKAVVYVYQKAGGDWFPIVGIAHWKEFAPIREEKIWREVLDKDGKPVMQTEGKFAGYPKKELQPTGKKYLEKDNWKTMPLVMIAKCAEAQALRKGWPEETGGMYLQEEMDNVNLSPIEEIEQFEEEERLKAVNGYRAIPMIMAMSEGLEMILQNEFCDKVLELVRNFESYQDLEMWLNLNRAGLQQFWAYNKADALELKEEIEKIKKGLGNE